MAVSCGSRRTCPSSRSQRPNDALPAGGRVARAGAGRVGLILGLTALFTIVILVVFGGTLAEVLDAIGDAIDAAG